MRRYIVEEEKVAANVRTVRSIANGAAVYGVLKADGYGLGLAPMAAALSAGGIDRFALTEPEDVTRLMDTGIPIREILLLRPVHDREEAERLLAKGLVTFSVGSPEDGAILARAGLRLGMRPRAHLQIDTGLGRYGIAWDEPMRARYMFESFPALSITGVYTHFAGGRIRRQYARFRSLLTALRSAGIDPGVRHCCASAALLEHPEMALDAVRIGSAFLGRVPGADRHGLVPVGVCHGQIETVRLLSPGQTVGYGGHFRTRREMRIAVVNVGSVHGLRGNAALGRQSLASGLGALLRAGRELLRGGSGLTAELNGRAVPVLGRVCAECAILDVTDVGCRPGDEALFALNPLYIRGMDVEWRREQTAPVTVFCAAAAGFRPVA